MNNNFAIEYATISIFNIQDSSLFSGYITNKNGEYEIDLPSQGSYYLKCSFVGFQSAIIQNILISKNSNKIELPTIVLIKGTRVIYSSGLVEKSIFSNKMESQSFNADQFQNSLGGTALDVIRNLPSININIEGDISLRTRLSNKVLIDGKLTSAKSSKKITTSFVDLLR